MTNSKTCLFQNRPGRLVTIKNLLLGPLVVTTLFKDQQTVRATFIAAKYLKCLYERLKVMVRPFVFVNCSVNKSSIR